VQAGVSLRTFYRWRQRLGFLTPPAVRRLQELELENRRLRAMLMRYADGVSWATADTKPASAVVPRTTPGSRIAAGYRNCRRG
jgi:putative transposase